MISGQNEINNILSALTAIQSESKEKTSSAEMKQQELIDSIQNLALANVQLADSIKALSDVIINKGGQDVEG